MTAAHLSFDPHLGWPVLIALGIAELIVWGLYLVRRGRAWLTRALALTLIAAAISNPLWVRENREALPSTVAIVVDQSSSMGVATGEQLQTRSPPRCRVSSPRWKM